MRRNKFFHFILLGVVSLFLLSLSLAEAGAQAGRGKGRLTGVVIDEGGRPVADVTVRLQFIREPGVQFETKTNRKGEWAFLGLGSGLWLITATAEGYVQATREINVSQLDQNPKVSLVLKKAQPAETLAEEEEEFLRTYDRATNLFNAREYDEALTLYQELLAKKPSYYQIYLNIGDCYREKGNFEEAIKSYNLVLEEAKKDEKWGKAFAGIGECYLRKGELDGARTYFQQAVDLYPDNEILAYNVGEIYFSHQKMDEAKQYYSLAIKIKPGWSIPYYKLGMVLLNQNDYAGAKENLKKFLEIEPESEQAAIVKNILEYLEKIKK